MYGNQFVSAVDNPEHVLDEFELHNDYMLGGSYHGNCYIYLVNCTVIRWSVSLRRVSKLVCVVEGARWNDFVMHNITCLDVAYIHFIEKGEDVFYVTCYSEDGDEFHNYEPKSAQFWRCLVPVTDTSLLMQLLPEDFLKYLNGPTPNDSVVVTTNTSEYNVRVESENVYDRYVHSFLFGFGWLRLVQDLNMKPGQWMVFTQVVPGEEYNVMLFEPDGGAITTVETYNTNIAMNALYHEAHDYDFEARQMNWMCNWTFHTVHDQEERAFYRKMTACFWRDGRISIPSRLVKKYNLYGFSVTVVKHETIEKVFEVRERTMIVGQGKVKRKLAIVSSASFKELREEAGFA